MVDRAGVGAGDLIVDLGAGTGALTAALVRVGARVIAVELHPGRAAALERRFGPATNVRVVVGDLATVALPTEPFRVVANPPWGLAEHLRTRLLDARSFRRADLVLARWQVERWIRRYPGVQAGPSIRAEAFQPCAPCGARVAILTGRARSANANRGPRT